MNADKRTVTVIVPVYNISDYLSECIESVIGQTYVDIELILVDDGSSDVSGLICDNYAEMDCRITVIHKENGGPNSARKKALNISKGDFVFFLDGDDYIDSVTIEIMLEKFNDGIDIVVAGCIKEYENKSIKFPMHVEGLFSGIETASEFFDIDAPFTNRMRTGLCPNLYRRYLIEQIFDDIDESIMIGEDIISLLAIYDARKVYYCDFYGYHYRMRQDSLMHAHNKSNFDDQYKIYRYMKKAYEKRDADDIYFKQLEQIVIENLLLGGYKRAFGWLSWLYPYDGVKKGSRIIVYGAGIFGKELMAFLLDSEDYKVIGWIDKEYIEENRCKTYRNIREIGNIEFDYIVVAILDYKTSNIIKIDLQNEGIIQDRIKVIKGSLIKKDYINHEFS